MPRISYLESYAYPRSHTQALRAIFPDELEEVRGAWPPIFSVRLSELHEAPGVGDAGVRLVFRFTARYPAAPPELELRAAGRWMFSRRAAVQRHLTVRVRVALPRARSVKYRTQNLKRP